MTIQFLLSDYLKAGHSLKTLDEALVTENAFAKFEDKIVSPYHAMTQLKDDKVLLYYVDSSKQSGVCKCEVPTERVHCSFKITYTLFRRISFDEFKENDPLRNSHESFVPMKASFVLQDYIDSWKTSKLDLNNIHDEVIAKIVRDIDIRIKSKNFELYSYDDFYKPTVYISHMGIRLPYKFNANPNNMKLIVYKSYDVDIDLKYLPHVSKGCAINASDLFISSIIYLPKL